MQRKVTHERISLMSPDSNFTIDYAARGLEEAGKESYTVLRGPFDQCWQSRLKMLVLNLFMAYAVEDSLLKMAR